MLSLLRRFRYWLKQRNSWSDIAASPASLYCIRPGYRHRTDNSFFDDTATADEWQREVYESAADYASENAAATVFDVGCGSAGKLLRYFSTYRTIGFDLAPTVHVLNERHPDREWRESDFSSFLDESCDVLICSDVVEHIPNPDHLMAWLSRIDCKRLYISTPERRVLYGFDQSGPPLNQAHCREWTMEEFRAYLEKWFTVKDLFISNRKQATQLAICIPKNSVRSS